MTVRDLFKTYRVFTISNFLSILRVLLVPLVWYYLANIENNPDFRVYAVLVSAFMVITDFLDGHLARKLGQETPLGQYLDPIADKIAILTILYLMHFYADYPLWIVLKKCLIPWTSHFFSSTDRSCPNPWLASCFAARSHENTIF